MCQTKPQVWSVRLFEFEKNYHSVFCNIRGQLWNCLKQPLKFGSLSKRITARWSNRLRSKDLTKAFRCKVRTASSRHRNPIRQTRRHLVSLPSEITELSGVYLMNPFRSSRVKGQGFSSPISATPLFRRREISVTNGFVMEMVETELFGRYVGLSNFGGCFFETFTAFL